VGLFLSWLQGSFPLLGGYPQNNRQIAETLWWKPPNIVYILLDDVGFGEIGMDELSVIRGYKTPRMSKLLSRFYDSYVESFQLIASSIADLKPIPDLPDTRSLVCEIESQGDDLRRSATRICSLVAIIVCQDS
jgi:hypothetical protein